jgi:4'-phosphopantetheinyl transferase
VSAITVFTRVEPLARARFPNSALRAKVPLKWPPTGVCGVGIDVEKINPALDIGSLANEALSPREARNLMALDKEQRLLAFYNMWTRKEACLKAAGIGLAGMTEQIEVSFLPTEPTRLIAISVDQPKPKRWTLVELSPAPR